MPRSIAIVSPNARTAPQGLQNDLPAMPPEPAIAPPAAPTAGIRNRMAAALRLPTDPVARRARLENAVFATGMTALGSGAIMAVIPVIRERASGYEAGHDLASSLEWVASAALVTVGLSVTAAAFGMRCAATVRGNGETVPQTMPPSPMQGIATRDLAPHAAAAGNTATVHDIETPVPRTHRLVADANSSVQSPA